LVYEKLLVLLWKSLIQKFGSAWGNGRESRTTKHLIGMSRFLCTACGIQYPDTTPERSVQENHIDPHASLRTLPSQLADGKRSLVGPQDKLPLTPAGASTIVGPKSKWLKPSSKTLEETR
jgi:hypothetical protein